MGGLTAAAALGETSCTTLLLLAYSLVSSCRRGPGGSSASLGAASSGQPSSSASASALAADLANKAQLSPHPSGGHLAKTASAASAAGGGGGAAAHPAPSSYKPLSDYQMDDELATACALAASEEDESAGGRPKIHLVVLGHVDAGKSTLMGRMLHELGVVDKRQVSTYTHIQHTPSFLPYRP